MDFSLSEEQKLFQATAREFATKEIEPAAARIDESNEFPAKIVSRLGEIGLQGVSIPEKLGGSGGDTLHVCIAAEEIARASAAVSAIWLVNLSLFAHCVDDFGNEKQKQHYIPPVVRGAKVGAFGLTEPGAGSDAGALVTSVSKKKDGYVLNGSKVFITNGKEANTVVVFATQDKSLGHRGISAFIVEKGVRGFSVGKVEHKMGMKGCSAAELVFEDCFVPLENRLGEEGRGLRIALETIDASRITVAMQAVGIARAAFEASMRYAQGRRQFGQPISQFQAIQWMLSDMAVSIDASRLLGYRAAFLKDQKQHFTEQGAMAKLFASETAMWVTTKAVQIHGGYGYTKDYPVERFFRDAKLTEIYEGTSEMQRWTIARNILA